MRDRAEVEAILTVLVAEAKEREPEGGYRLVPADDDSPVSSLINCIHMDHKIDPDNERCVICGQLSACYPLLLVAEVERLLALVAERAAQIAAVKALAEKWRYKGEFGWGAWQEGHGPDQEGWVLDQAATELRAALAGDADPADFEIVERER